VSRYFLMAFALGGIVAAQAQTGNPLSTELKQMYTGVKNNLVRMADKMPEEHYSFKPVPEIRTFGELVAHVADSQAGACSSVNGEAKAINAAQKKSKDELVAALKESFALCDTAFDALSDSTASQMVKTRRGERSKLGALAGTVSHSNEEYGYMAVYLRLKNIVPPSSEKR
jgi:DinB superfamily